MATRLQFSGVFKHSLNPMTIGVAGQHIFPACCGNDLPFFFVCQIIVYQFHALAQRVKFDDFPLWTFGFKIALIQSAAFGKQKGAAGKAVENPLGKGRMNLNTVDVKINFSGAIITAERGIVTCQRGNLGRIYKTLPVPVAETGKLLRIFFSDCIIKSRRYK